MLKNNEKNVAQHQHTCKYFITNNEGHVHDIQIKPSSRQAVMFGVMRFQSDVNENGFKLARGNMRQLTIKE